ncbi:MAG: DUF2065 domain-containing protein, partial [Gammaproteobacteria bacterium]|nr:DUF2065 domain-containing protein [Gammaproteobacteria bacterium]
GFEFMWQDLWVALALVMVIEGLIPFINPKGYRRMVMMMSIMDDKSLRRTGFVIMVTGAILVYLLKH